MGKLGWDLPPGVTTSMLPGNSPEEQAAEALAEKVFEMLEVAGMTGKGIEQSSIDSVVEKISAMLGVAYGDGFKQGQLDAALASEQIIGED